MSSRAPGPRRKWFRGRGGRRGHSEHPAHHVQPRRAPSNERDGEQELSREWPPRHLVSSTVASLAMNSNHLIWRPFISGKDLEPSSIVERKLPVAVDYLRKHLVIDNESESQSFRLEYQALITDSDLRASWSTLQRDLEEDGERVLGIFGVACLQIGSSMDKLLYPRLYGFGPLTAVQKLRTSLFGKLVAVKGTVIKISNIKQICTWLTFQCDKCQSLLSTEQPFGKYQCPTSCPTKKCRSTTFVPKRSHAQTLTTNWQSIELQEIQFCETGRVSRTIMVELTGDLCDVVCPSDVVIVTGVLKAAAAVDYAAQQQGSAGSIGMYQLYLHAVSLESNNKPVLSEFSDLDKKAIGQIQSIGKSLFKLLVASLCPSIYGHELVKAGLLLGLFGGTPKNSGVHQHVLVRGDPHILVVGDPGLGKSQMLLACSNVAPKGIFITATGVTTSGLTITLSKEAGNEFMLEAGALVLSDQGCCCIDEFDKMSGHHNALLEAMEQQSVSVAKSGVLCSLPARTGVLAAANPVGGHYNCAKTVSENLKMNAALLSRFDIVFILVDKPNKETDAFLSDHIMNMHTKKAPLLGTLSSSLLTTNSSDDMSEQASLAERLRFCASRDADIDLIPHILMKRYIAYARKCVHPKLSDEACQEIQDFYLQLRAKHQSSSCTPITTRQLESLIRLTEARAKLELRKLATREDALDVIEIMKESMVDVLSVPFTNGTLDFSRSINGSGMSSRSLAKRFLSALQLVAEAQQTRLFSEYELQQVFTSQAVQGSSSEFRKVVASLNNQGFMIKKSPDQYQLLSVA